MGKKAKLHQKKGKKKSPDWSSRQAINQAINLYKRRQPKVICCEQSGVSRPTLDRYIKHHNILPGDKTAVLYDELPKGRESIVSKIVGLMRSPVRISKKSIKQQFCGRGYQVKATEVLAEAQLNPLQTIQKISKKTFNRAWIISCGEKRLRVSASFSDRAIALCDYRNPLSCAVTWNVCLNVGKVSPCNIWSCDDVAAVLNPMTQRLQVIRMTKDEHEELKSKHLTAGAAKDDRPSEAMNVVAKLFNCVNAEGFRGPIVAKLLDHDFKWKDTDSWMKIYPANKSMHLYVACVNKSHPLYDDVIYYQQMFDLVIVPFLIEHRRMKFVSAKFAQSSLSSPMAGFEVELEDENGERIIITMDGAYPGIESILRSVGMAMLLQGIEAFKWAGGCSLVQQPADVATTHKDVHRNAASDAVTYDENGAPTVEMQTFITFFKTLGPKGARLNTHEKFLRHFEWLVDSSWQKRNITEGWRISGIWPYDAAKILSGWSGWKYLPGENAAEIVRLCTDMEEDAASEVLKHKRLDDLTCESIFAHLIEDDDLEQFKRDKDWRVTPMNDRCLMLTTRAFDNQCTYLQGVLDNRRAAESRLFAARGAVIDGIQYCICGNKLPKDVAKHLTTKLHETGCRRKGAWQEVQESAVSDDAVLDTSAFVTPPPVAPQSSPAASPELSESMRIPSRKHMSRLNYLWEFEHGHVERRSFESSSLQLVISLLPSV